MSRRPAAVLLALLIAGAACGGDDHGATSTSLSATTHHPVETPVATTPIAADEPVTTAGPSADPPRVLVVGDSTLLAVEWYEQFAPLSGLDMTFDAKSCRTVGVPSCAVPPPAPPNVVETVAAASGPFDVVVVMAGYDEWWTSFPASFDAAVAAARAQGASRIVWLTYVESSVYRGLAEAPLTEALERNNATLRDKVASGDYPDVTLADWNTYVRDHPNWLEDDGIHLTIAGATGVADFIAREVAHLTGGPCPAPTVPGGQIDDPCPDPLTIPPIGAVVDLYS